MLPVLVPRTVLPVLFRSSAHRSSVKASPFLPPRYSAGVFWFPRRTAAANRRTVRAVRLNRRRLRGESTCGWGGSHHGKIRPTARHVKRRGVITRSDPALFPVSQGVTSHHSSSRVSASACV